MANFTRNFLAGRMNKIVDERLLPDGEYVDAMNVRMGSTEMAEVGVVTNTMGNILLSPELRYIDGTLLSTEARTIGAIEDSANETIYWFVHDPAFTTTASGPNPTNKLDLVVSFNVLTGILTYHIISINDGSNINTTLNFNSTYLITGVNLIDNLLFWTDDYNAPRNINIKRNYPNPVANIDGGGNTPLPNGIIPQEVFQESILVIKKPPIESPQVSPITTSGQQNFLETRFICFAYRYKYIDGEYSATSQWSAPAFVPNQFRFSANSMLNEGMTNFCNTAIINYNTGGPLVVGIDLLFKQSENNVIKIIQQLNKAEDLGGVNNQVLQYSFNNSKIFTILNEAEILRLYDNVPRFAKAQTIMGNRLMFGNYVEGYNLIDKNGQPTKIEYSTNLITEVIGDTTLEDSTGEGLYNIDPASIGLGVDDSIVYFDLANSPLVEGASISLDVIISHKQWSGDLPFPDQETNPTSLVFNFLLTQNYSSVYELATSPQFENAVGTALNILPVSTTVIGQDTSCNGVSFTDSVNCELPFNLGTSPTLIKKASGINAITAALQPIKIITTPASTLIGFQFLAMQYVDDITTPTKTCYEYYQVVSATATFQKISSPQSLHSNRGYEVGLVYMDEFNRATTALVSTNNAEFVPCGYAPNKNSIQVIIPYTQRAPKWATRYKFVIKPDVERYETIYSNLFFVDTETNEAWFLLEGENMRKVENGDRLIVKADTQGPTLNCIYATVLDKQSQAEAFLEIPTESDPTKFLKVPAGLYMKLNPSTFNLIKTENAIIAPGQIQVYGAGGDHVFLKYPMNVSGSDPSNPTFTYIDYDVNPGTRIDWYTDWNRAGINSCEQRGYTLDKTYTSSADYDNMYEWFVGDNIQLTINTGVDKGDNETNVFIQGTNRKLNDPLLGITTSTAVNKVIDSNATFITDGVVPGVIVINVTQQYGYYSVVTNVISETELEIGFDLFPSVGTVYDIQWKSVDINFWRFYREPITNELSIYFSSTSSCEGKNYKISRRIYITANIEVFRAENTIIFETEPSDALPDVFFENELSFPIDIDGNHAGNIQDQDIISGIPGIVDTHFFNCYSFGNGAESYKIRDSIVGRSFNFGERVTTVAEQDYKAADRFSDITYSGIYNGESNVNKLNEFNSGLSNFKHCESSFGEIQLLDGRNTDILTLQEDKISYVLAEKNLLSDASAGGIITATPEVLGTQMARTEKYGISFNPESYVQWGFDRFFTDAKRGAVIQLKGGDSQSEQLVAISEQSMRTWFRDKFNASFNFQKLGGFDPYMNEYVLSMNDQKLPSNPQCLNCGVSQTFTFSIAPPETIGEFKYCVDLGPLVGLSEIIWNFINIEPGAELQVSVLYNGITTTTGLTDLNGSIFFDKDDILIETAEITLLYTGDMVVDILADCCQAEPMTIVEVVVTNNSESGSTIHTQYRYTNGTFIGPLLQNLVLFSSGSGVPLVSRYNTVSGFVGNGGFPPEFSNMRLATNAIAPDNYVFDIAQDKFRYFRSSTLYNNNNIDIQALLALATTATPNAGSAPIYYADFTVPASSNGEYLYLIWDLRDAIPAELCFGENLNDSCCNCVLDDYYLNASFATATCVFDDINLSIVSANGFYSTGGFVRELVDGLLLPQQPCGSCGVEVSLCFGTSVSDVCCNCGLTCPTPFNYYQVTNNEAFDTTVYIYNEFGVLTSLPLAASSTTAIYCSIGEPFSNTSITITYFNCDCAF